MSRRLIAVIALAAAASACDEHLQEEGRYAFTATEVLEDTCAVLPSGEALWDGSLRRDGEVVVVEYDLFQMTLFGYFRQVSEEFYADGSAANQTVEVAGVTCVVDTVTVHLDARAEDTGGAMSTAFTGTLTVSYHSVDQERCRCDLRVAYRAERTDG